MYHFHLAENHTTVTREILAGCVTYAAMAYILCVQPALMSGELLGLNTGMDQPALVTATCLVCAFGSIFMGLYARYPFAMAPGMGTNVYVVAELFPACAVALGMAPNCGAAEVWMLGMGVVFAAGFLFFIISLLNIREHLLFLMSHSLKMAICAGVGLFLAFLGIQNATLLQIAENQPQLGPIVTWDVAIFLTGFLVSAILMIRKFPGAILWGMLAASLLAFFTGKLPIEHVMSLPANPMKVVGKLDLGGTFAHIWELFPFIFILTFIDVFDAFGTFLGMGSLGGFFREDGTLPRMNRLFIADAVSTMVGAYGGHSTMTTYLESSAGIESGGRTGLVSLTVGILFLISLFFSPLIIAVGKCAPITSSALILVGILMTRSIQEIDWNDLTEAIPAFLVVAGIPFFNSITDGILCGLTLYPFLKLFTGHYKEVKPGMYVLSVIMIFYVIFFA